jgi:hypothetical protein
LYRKTSKVSTYVGVELSEAQLGLRQYLYFCTSKASTVSTYVGVELLEAQLVAYFESLVLACRSLRVCVYVCV